MKNLSAFEKLTRLNPIPRNPIVRGVPGVDKVPAHLTRGEAVLPVKTVRGIGGSEAVRRLITLTTGKPPAKVLKKGGHYDDGYDGGGGYDDYQPASSSNYDNPDKPPSSLGNASDDDLYGGTPPKSGGASSSSSGNTSDGGNDSVGSSFDRMTSGVDYNTIPSAFGNSGDGVSKNGSPVNPANPQQPSIKPQTQQQNQPANQRPPQSQQPKQPQPKPPQYPQSNPRPQPPTPPQPRYPQSQQPQTPPQTQGQQGQHPFMSSSQQQQQQQQPPAMQQHSTWGTPAYEAPKQQARVETMGGGFNKMISGISQNARANQVNDRDSKLATDRYNQLLSTNASRYNSDNSLSGQKYGANSSALASRYASDNSLTGSLYGSDASMYNANVNANASNYNSDNTANSSRYGSDASMYNAQVGANASLAGHQIQAGASNYASDNSANASRYGSDASLAGHQIQAGASNYASDNSLQGTMYASDNSLAAHKLATDVDWNKHLNNYGLQQQASDRQDAAFQTSNAGALTNNAMQVYNLNQSGRIDALQNTIANSPPGPDRDAAAATLGTLTGKDTYSPVKTYDDMGQVTGEMMVNKYTGQPIERNAKNPMNNPAVKQQADQIKALFQSGKISRADATKQLAQLGIN